jgi:DNA repair exonuclease SbcCD nuclease subunit
LQDQLDCLRWLYHAATQSGCEAMVIAGDVFESRVHLDLSVLDSACRLVHEWDMPIYIVVGNHDSYLRSAAINSAQAFRGKATVVDRPWVCSLGKGDVKLGMIPWTDDLDEFRRGVSEMAQLCADVLVSHVMMEGPHAGGSSGFPLSVFSSKWPRDVFLGHVHEPLVIGTPKSGPCWVRYIGSPMQLDYRDAGGRRGFYVYDTRTRRADFVENLTSPRFHIVTDGSAKIAVGERDFVWVRTPDPALALRLAEQFKAQRVQVDAVADEEVRPRLSVSSSDADRDILTRYMELAGVSGDEVLAQGLSILQQARAGG